MHSPDHQVRAVLRSGAAPPRVAPVVHGTCADEFAALHDLLETNLAGGEDVGASLAVVHDGELVVDLWGGEARPGVPWERDTITLAYSVTKTMSALAVLTLVDR